MKFTVQELIDELKNFPRDLKIETELSLMWNYPDEMYDLKRSTDPEYIKSTQNNATDLCIFEGSWQKGNVSDVEGKYKEFFKEYHGVEEV